MAWSARALRRSVHADLGILDQCCRRLFAKLTDRRLKRGVFHSIVALQAAINRFVKEANQTPKPFRWIKDPDEIIAAVRQGHQALDAHH
jgi:hypothetical protein